MTDLNETSVRRGSGNVFADIGLPDAKEHGLKADFAIKIGQVMRDQKLTQKKAAELTGVSQPDISRILRGEFRDVSTDRLIRILLGLRAELDITITHAGHAVGQPIHVGEDRVRA